MPVERAVRVAPASAVQLDYGWELCRTRAGDAAEPRDLATVAHDEWIAALVPGTVAQALRAAGRWDWTSTESIDASDWWYRVRFGSAATGDEILCLDGLATLADVWLNGSHILRSESMFASYRVPVGRVLRGDDELIVRFSSLRAALAERRPRPRWKTRLVEHQSLRWFRTTLLGRMPGWSNGPETVGPWRAVSIVRGLDAIAANATLQSQLHGNDGVVTIRIDGDSWAALEPVAVTVGGQASLVRHCNGGGIATVTLEDPKRWWPHTHGDQWLYPVTLSAGEASIELGAVGFRELRLDTTDGGFAFEVNGHRVFMRGACWAPLDAVTLRGTRDEYARVLARARDAGMNMIRVGGTMVYEDDAFYELCDELGILVWQDCMFANMDYPADDERFVAECSAELLAQLGRIGRHPSLALVCGNSEVQQQAAMLGLPREEWISALFDDLVPGIAAAACPGVPYWSSTPSGGALPFHVSEGDGHYFGYGPYLRAASDVRASNVRFASETLALAHVPEPAVVDRMPCGAHGAGHHPAWKLGVPRDNGSSWDFEDVRDHYAGDLFGVDVARARREDPERYLALGRVVSVELVTRAMSEWRRASSICNGALLWTYRDLRPGAGWGVLDVDGNPKSVYYALKRVQAPVALLAIDEGLNGLDLEAVNDTASTLRGTLKVSLYNGSVCVASGTREVHVGPHGHSTLRVDDVLGSFTDVTYAYRFGPAAHDLVVATLTRLDGDPVTEAFHYPLGLPHVRSVRGMTASSERAEHGARLITVSARDGAFAIALDARGWDLDDNYFNLAPGGTRRVRATPRARPSASIAVSALNATETLRVTMA